MTETRMLDRGKIRNKLLQETNLCIAWRICMYSGNKMHIYQTQYVL